jgi:hypothetical protein
MRFIRYDEPKRLRFYGKMNENYGDQNNTD